MAEVGRAPAGARQQGRCAVTSRRRRPSREMDDQAIEALCFLLDRSATPRSGLESTRGEKWSTILRRRLKGKYPRTRTGRVRFMHWHFHLRRAVKPDEGEKKSAAHVAEIWKANEVTLRTHANRNREKTGARRWITAEVKRLRRPFPGAGGKRLSTAAARSLLCEVLARIAVPDAGGKGLSIAAARDLLRDIRARSAAQSPIEKNVKHQNTAMSR